MKLITIITLSLNSLFFLSAQSTLFNEDLNYSQVQFVKMTEDSNGKWRLDVTIRHNDTSWDHYADLWIVVDPETEEILGRRVLAHPHIGEQPFTRSLSGLTIDNNINIIEVRSKCTLHDYNGKSVLIDLNKEEGIDYKIIRRSL